MLPREIREGRVPFDENREWSTMIDSASAAGEDLPEFVILAAKVRKAEWMTVFKDKRAAIALSDNGWTSNYLGLEWLKHFDAHTKHRAVGAYRMLIVDRDRYRRGVGARG